MDTPGAVVPVITALRARDGHRLGSDVRSCSPLGRDTARLPLHPPPRSPQTLVCAPARRGCRCRATQRALERQNTKTGGPAATRRPTWGRAARSGHPGKVSLPTESNRTCPFRILLDMSNLAGKHVSYAGALKGAGEQLLVLSNADPHRPGVWVLLISGRLTSINQDGESLWTFDRRTSHHSLSMIRW